MNSLADAKADQCAVVLSSAFAHGVLSAAHAVVCAAGRDAPARGGVRGGGLVRRGTGSGMKQKKAPSDGALLITWAGHAFMPEPFGVSTSGSSCVLKTAPSDVFTSGSIGWQ